MHQQRTLLICLLLFCMTATMHVGAQSTSSYIRDIQKRFLIYNTVIGDKVYRDTLFEDQLTKRYACPTRPDLNIDSLLAHISSLGNEAYMKSIGRNQHVQTVYIKDTVFVTIPSRIDTVFLPESVSYGTLQYHPKTSEQRGYPHQVITVRDTVYIDHTNGELAAQASKKKELDNEADLLYTKPIGRYDRGIKNYRFIPKKHWIGGITFSYANFDSDENRMLFSFIKDFSMDLRSFSVKPFFGYAVRDNQILGLKFGYNRTTGNLDNFSFEIDEDLSFTMKDLRYTEDVYSVAFFHRSYIGLDPGKRFGLFNENYISYNNGTNSFKRGVGNEMKQTNTRVNEINIGIKPGLCVFIMENVSAEFSIGVAGFKYRMEEQKNNEGEEGKRRSSGANFKINLLNIGIGITACF